MATLKKIVSRAGGITVMAKSLGVSPQVICNWIKRGQVPAPHVIEFERLTGESRYDLRPDIFGKPEQVAA